MRKKFAITALAIMCVVFMVGVVLIFSAYAIGQNAGNTFMSSQHGTYYTGDVDKIIDSTTLSCQLGGSAIALVGGFGLLGSGYALYKEM